MHLLEKATVQSFHRQRLGADTLHALAYRDAQSQRLRFEALAHWGDFSGLTVLDLGCGYGDLLPFLRGRFTGVTYLGVDFLREFVEAARARHGEAPGVQFLQADFLTTGLPQVDVVVACGSLNYRSTNDLHPWQAIARMWAAARCGVAFNVLDATVFGADPVLAGQAPGTVLDFCRRMDATAGLVTGYLPDDFTVLMHRAPEQGAPALSSGG